MNKYNNLLIKIANELNIKKGNNEPELQYKSRIIYSAISRLGYSSLWDKLEDDIPVSYETAGMLFGGKMVWMLAKMPSTTIVGDEFERYFLFSNSHDGTSAVRCCLTNIRVVCKNTLNLALREAKRSWRYTHAGDLASKIVDAKNTLIYANEYNKAFGFVPIGKPILYPGSSGFMSLDVNQGSLLDKYPLIDMGKEYIRIALSVLSFLSDS